VAVAGPAVAQPIDLKDGQGRVVHFDAPDQAAAARLTETVNALIHGVEVSSVTIRIVTPTAVMAACGSDAAGCYQSSSRGGNTIYVPTGDTGPDVLTHEYGHHIEQSRRTSFTALGTGVPGWWRARTIDGLLQGGLVARDYSLGWYRSISEIFAEDYAGLNGTTRRWRMLVDAPGPDVLAALRTDLVGAAPTPAAAAPAAQPATPTTPAAPTAPAASAAQPPGVQTATEVRKQGTLAPGASASIPFSVPAPGHGVVVGVRLSGRGRATSARADVRCGGKLLGGKAGRARRPISFRVATPGPAECQLVLGKASSPVNFRVAMRVTPPRASTR
jgi:hypothetical protein